MIDMIWKGDSIQNFGSRMRGNKKYVPAVIVNHISAGTMASMGNWFRNRSSQASSHFGVGRDGAIHQFVRIENAAWTQGLTTESIPLAVAEIVRRQGVNPNLYCVSIEHEGYVGNGIDGDLTEAQFWSSVWLHKYIQSEGERISGHHIQFGPQFVIGHHQVDPKRKRFCPGNKFPWQRLYAELAKAEGKALDQWTEYVDFHRSGSGDFAKAYQASERARDLGNKLADTQWKEAAEASLLQLKPVLPGMETAGQIVRRILELYQKLIGGGKWSAEALRKLLIVYVQMKQTGLL